MDRTLTVEPFSLDLARPLSTADRTITHRDGFLVRIERDGVEGIGEATPLPGWTESIDECRTALERAVSVSEREPLARSTTDRETILAEVPASCPAARHGLALAFSDLRARQARQPLYRYLGGTERVTSVPVNATIGDGSVEATVRAATRAVDRGYDCLKCKVGARPVTADVERLRAVRDAVGPAVELRGDANGAWSREQADRAFEELEAVNISYVEQPLSPDNIEGHTALRGGDVGVALDETLAEISVNEILSAGAADVLILKPMVLGGLDRVRDAAIMAHEGTDSTSSEDVIPIVTTTIDGAYARSGAVHVAASISGISACGLATGDRLAEDLLTHRLPATRGRIAVPQGNGNISRRSGITDA
nr:o-succinylbenzoate synthase [Halocatena marina]